MLLIFAKILGKMAHWERDRITSSQSEFVLDNSDAKEWAWEREDRAGRMGLVIELASLYILNAVH